MIQCLICTIRLDIMKYKFIWAEIVVEDPGKRGRYCGCEGVSFFMKAMILFLEEPVGHNKMLILYKLQNLCIIQHKKLIGEKENNSLQKATIKLTVKYLKETIS